MAKGRLVLAVVACVALLAACKSPEQIRAEEDAADEQRCARMGVPVVPGDPGYIQCRMWAAQMRAQEEEERRQNVLLALQAFSVLQQQRRSQPYYDEEPPLPALPQAQWSQPQWPQAPWITPPAPQNTWCRPVGRWMSCTTQ